MKKLITLDVGTTAVKAGLFDQDLTPLGFVIREYQLLTPGADRIELDPQIYWDCSVASIRQLIADTGIDPEDVVSITCTTQGETLIPVDQNGDALGNAIVWLDSRAKEESDYIRKQFANEQFYRKTGLPEITPYCPISKLLWLKNNEPDLYEKAFKIVLLEDYLVLQLCGFFVTNPALMCSTGYYDIDQGIIWQEILECCGLDEQKIPQVVDCGIEISKLKKPVAELLGLPAHVIVSTGAMDQVASAIGSGNVQDGFVSETTGTAQVIAATCDRSVLAHWSPVSVYCHACKDKYLLINISQTAGIILKWFRDEFCIDLIQDENRNAFAQMDQAAAAQPPLSKGLMLFPHLTGMQVPQVDPKARGVFFGVGLDTGRGCFIRAILEGVGYMLRENIEALSAHGHQPTTITSLGGGSKSPLWNQIKADICNVDLVIMQNEESTSLGAAILGGVASGLFKSIESGCALLAKKQKYEPCPETAAAYESGYQKYKQMYGQFASLF